MLDMGPGAELGKSLCDSLIPCAIHKASAFSFISPGQGLFISTHKPRDTWRGKLCRGGKVCLLIWFVWPNLCEKFVKSNTRFVLIKNFLQQYLLFCEENISRHLNTLIRFKLTPYLNLNLQIQAEI